MSSGFSSKVSSSIIVFDLSKTSIVFCDIFIS
nr:MAG TPA: hypothetical protein [Bacteriophage sp.]